MGFYFNKNYSIPFKISDVSPNGIVYFVNGRRASWKKKDAQDIQDVLPPIDEFNLEIFQDIRNRFHTRLSDVVTGRIIFNLYYCNLADILELKIGDNFVSDMKSIEKEKSILINEYNDLFDDEHYCPNFELDRSVIKDLSDDEKDDLIRRLDDEKEYWKNLYFSLSKGYVNDLKKERDNWMVS